MCYASATAVKVKLAEYLGEAYTLGEYEHYWAASGFDFPFLPALTSDAPFTVRSLQWGLIPGWAKTRQDAQAVRSKTLNARSETIFETASFREPILHSRCLLLVAGFFEWQHIGKQTQPYYIHMPGKEPFAMGGVHSTWVDPETAEVYETSSIITTPANELMSRIHNDKKRMPLILDKPQWHDWLDDHTTAPHLKNLMLPYPDGRLEADPVNNLISSRTKDRNVPDVQQPIQLVSQTNLGF